MRKISRLIVFMGRKMNHFTRVLAATLVLCMLVMLTSCSDEWTTVGASSSDAIGRKSSSVSIASASPENNEDFVNKDLLALIGGTNEQLKQWRNEKCCAYNIGSQTEALAYYNPYIEVLFLSKGTSSWNAEWEDYYLDDVVYSENPYVDDFMIWGLSFEAARELSPPTVINQDSLRQLFITDKLITYNLISEELGQWPLLKPAEDYRTLQPLVEYTPFVDIPGVSIEGIGYTASYFIYDLQINIAFLIDDSEYIACGVYIDAVLE